MNKYIIFAMALLTTPVMAQGWPERTVEFGPWSVQSYLQRNAPVCLLGSSDNSKTFIMFRSTANVGMEMLVYNQSWNMPKESVSGNITLRIGNVSLRAAAANEGNTMRSYISSNPSDAENMFDRMMRTNDPITVLLPSGATLFFKREGLREAATSFGQCVTALPNNITPPEGSRRIDPNSREAQSFMPPGTIPPLNTVPENRNPNIRR